MVEKGPHGGTEVWGLLDRENGKPSGCGEWTKVGVFRRTVTVLLMVA